ncbi:MAG: hypothetical protein GKR87_15805 [Kiritimatiellae bacterium]|nr:hypothetical protein [Kiritimatiellia bacterium]
MPFKHSTAFTLIELLVALVIAVFAITLIGSVYQSTLTTLHRQKAYWEPASSVQRAVEQLTKDLSCSIPDDSENTCLFSLQPPTKNGLAAELSFCTAVRSEYEKDLRWFEVYRVRYTMIVDEDEKQPALIRETQPIVGPGAFMPPKTNTLFRRLIRLEIKAYDGDEWLDSWSTVDEQGLPEAAEITCVYEDDKKKKRTVKTEVFIPAGKIITPRTKHPPGTKETE